MNSREEFENRKLSEKVESNTMGNKLYQRRQTQEDWNGRSTATTRKLVRRQTRKGKTWDRSGEPGAGQVGQVNWPANEGSG